MLHRVPAICAALALIITPVWLFATNPAVGRSHPLLPSLLLAALVIGLAVVVLTVHAGRRRRGPQGRRGSPVPAGIGALVAIGLMAAFAWLEPFALTDEQGGAAGVSLVNVDLIEDATSITLAPTGGATRGLVFYPGARVEALAYVPLLSRVAQEGTVVVVLKEPLGISLLQPGQARSALEAHPGIGRWVAGGHSLGGVAASAFASGNDAVHGLLLWASYPLDDLSASGLDVLSVSGSQDRLTTPADVGASRNSLPAGARFTEISGAVHAFFGDYGDQPGDGVARTDRRDAQDGIVEATNEFLAH
ncbi:alpha/beta hydrolase [Arthrobacter sp. MDT2-16]